MKRNGDRIWYSKGYKDGVRDTQRDAKVPKVVGIIIATALLTFDQYWILAFVTLWVCFELFEWWDLKKYHESKPPEMWRDMDE